jgi:D-ribose pyranase
MKKKGVLNSEIAAVLALMGHTDTIVIGDCGLPIPSDVKRIDLSVKIGNPSFIEVLEMILEDFECEKATLANEIMDHNQEIYKQITTCISVNNIQFTDHAQLKALLKNAKAIIRTGEATPYANIILHSGVLF